MFPVMQSSSRLNAYAFVLLLSVMFVASIPELIRFSAKETEAASLYLSGDLSRKFESEYDSQFVLRDMSIEMWANLQYLVFGEGSSGVILGRDDWLFTSEEYLVSPDFVDLQSSSLENVQSIARNLADKGKKLVMIPVPLKADIYSELTTFRPGYPALHTYDYLVTSLQVASIPVVDTRSALLSSKEEGLTFLKRDTHWTPLGARTVAAEVARTYPELRGNQQYASRKTGQKEYPGDLRNFLQFSSDFSPELHAPEPIDLYETTRSDDQFSEDALFGDDADYHVLVGSSYTDIDDWNFVGFLKESLGHDIVPYALKAEGPWKAMETYLSQLDTNEDDASVVLWEFPVRVMLSRKKVPANWEQQMDQFFASDQISETTIAAIQ